MSHLDQSNLH